MKKTPLISDPAACATATTDMRDGGGLMLQVTPRKGEDGFARSWLWRYTFKGVTGRSALARSIASP
jgi:hypothetical protein